MLEWALDKKLCLESHTLTSNAGISVRQKAILEAALHKKLCFELR